ncbi:efflux RND transporter periplasmic adaptor subunit [Gluconobacter wancherniae]|uniref:RND transporter MFP subunit n=1 Tax=Gluconobacter wancherniae NBRC 103581 TaxID=656744 RepID=A0A511AZV9_9PROT|nr:efflux RND transporter periplasmic adaptor subunit [Gluconobacter wancherniae]MBF0854427.1 efflux RND transporter periplasmic adaptor subunit [Gluconobacter wancherniae]MBS1062822.1 efflux RND transporter periplasmic adaptor subunit [Gluconobacter wancherniae]MBS1088442.1 efflux RND transporter periplasmic adaptor subunit [Gluconobacter wancherniae]MBS1094956.1 efflux RND transporter periplasmic adaptor subunit [Gluconobacter wancherniae]GBD57488.1 RND transporter MFP subunit [Gluconobacter
MASTSRKIILGAGVCVLGLYVAGLVVGRVHAVSTLNAETIANAVPDVAVISPRHTSPKVALTLPGTIDAWYSAPIYPQVSGYVQMWYKDYGAQVHKGDVLAEINAPALDAQYAQAKADLAAVMAKYNLAVVTANRWRTMAKSQSVSGQSVSVSNANEQSANAEVQAAQRNVDHFEALERFKQIVAPFDGVVTSRSVSVGDYVNNGGGGLNATGAASELFTVADTHKLRLFVSVPEVFSYILQDGLTAKVRVPQFAGKTFDAQYIASSHGYDPNTRTAVTEFTMENPDHLLWPGTFASIALSAQNTSAKLFEIPTGCLVFQEKGMQVAVVDQSNHVHYRNIKVGRMADSSTEIQAGVTPEDRIINNPPADLLEGDPVHVVTPARGYDQSGATEGSEDSDDNGDE